MMGQKAKNKKGFISEEDTATLLQRYSVTTVLALLQEVAHWPSDEAKIDWNQLVAKTTTGITNAREYQMVWRHLAYREALTDKFDNGAPIEDDSDLEYEVEVLPAVTYEATTEAAACVKVLIASGLPNEASRLNGTIVEAPLIINIPNGQPCKTYDNSQPTASAKGMNITVQVSVQKQTLPAATTSAAAKLERFDSNRSASDMMAPRKKRKKWSQEEDMELINAVEKYGVGSWTAILKAGFKGERTANQLSQRWGIVKRRLDISGAREGGRLSSKPSQALLAAHNAMNHFLDDGLNRTANSVGTAGTNENKKSAGTIANSKSAVTNGTSDSGLHTTTAKDLATETHQMESLGSIPKARVTSKKTLPKPKFVADPLRDAAVAAGARVVSASDAAQLKAAQAKGAIHIMGPKGGAVKTLPPGSSSIKPEPHPNVHHIRTGLAVTPSSVLPPTPKHPVSVKALPQTSQQASKIDASKKTNGINVLNSSSGAEHLAKREDRKGTASISGCAPMEQDQDGAVLSRMGQVQKDKIESPKVKAMPESLLANTRMPTGSGNTEKDESNDKAVLGAQAEETQVTVEGATAVISEDKSTAHEQTKRCCDRLLMQKEAGS